MENEQKYLDEGTANVSLNYIFSLRAEIENVKDENKELTVLRQFLIHLHDVDLNV